MLDSINLLSGLSQKMGFLQTRQRVISENISNADAPGYMARDVQTPNFEQMLHKNVTPVAGEPLALTKTNSAHIGFGATPGRPENGSVMRKTYEVTPSKNSVNIEEQMMMASTTAVDYQLATNLYNKNLDLLRAAIRG